MGKSLRELVLASKQAKTAGVLDAVMKGVGRAGAGLKNVAVKGFQGAKGAVNSGLEAAANKFPMTNAYARAGAAGLGNEVKDVGSDLGAVGRGAAGVARRFPKTTTGLAAAGATEGISTARTGKPMLTTAVADAGNQAVDKVKAMTATPPGPMDGVTGYLDSFAQSPTKWGLPQWGGIGAAGLLSYLALRDQGKDDDKDEE